MPKPIAAVLALLTLSSPCLARPRHWYQDWKVWAGEAVIVGSLVADGRSTCAGFSRGLVEGNYVGRGSHNCGLAVGILAAGGGVYTSLHLWQAEMNESEPSKAWRAVGLLSVPTVVCAFHCTAAIRNYDKLTPR